MEAKRALEENERKRFKSIFSLHFMNIFVLHLSEISTNLCLSYLALKQSEKENDKKAREKIRWKLEQDKVCLLKIL